MVKGKTKSGIRFQIDERIKSDARFIYYLSKMSNKDVEISETSNALMGMLQLIFGSDEGVFGFMNAVAASNDGVCDVEKMLTELSDIFDHLNAKNLSSSRKSSTSARNS